MNIQLPTGKTISISVYEYLFILKDEDMDTFYQNCIADDVGNYIEDPFSDASMKGKLEVDEPVEIPEVPIEEKPEI